VYYIVWGIVYAKRSCLLHLGVGLSKTKQICHVGDGYARQGSWQCLGAGLCKTKPFVSFRVGLRETGLLASFGGWFTRNEAACFISGLGYTGQGSWHCLWAGLCETKPFASFGGNIMRNEAAGFVWELGYMRQGSWHRFEAGLCETKPFASFGGRVMRNEAACFVWEVGYMRQAPGVVWMRFYAKGSRLLRLGAGLCEKKPLASFGSWVT